MQLLDMIGRAREDWSPTPGVSLMPFGPEMGPFPDRPGPSPGIEDPSQPLIPGGYEDPSNPIPGLLFSLLMEAVASGGTRRDSGPLSPADAHARQEIKRMLNRWDFRSYA